MAQQDVAAIRQSVLMLMDATNNNPTATLTEYVQNPRVTSVNDETIVSGWDKLVEQTRAAQAGSFSIQTGTLDIVGMGPDHALVIAPFTMYYRTTNGVVTAPGSMTLAYERTALGGKSYTSTTAKVWTTRRSSGFPRQPLAQHRRHQRTCYDCYWPD